MYLAAVLGSPSGLNAGVGLQQVLNECDGQSERQKRRRWTTCDKFFKNKIEVKQI